jgi:2-haloacid dehalogenase
MMVAAHSSDLAAAAELGLRTAHIARPDEKGKCRGEAAPNVSVDVAAGDLQRFRHGYRRYLKDLADKLCL